MKEKNNSQNAAYGNTERDENLNENRRNTVSTKPNTSGNTIETDPDEKSSGSGRTGSGRGLTTRDGTTGSDLDGEVTD